MTPFKLGKKPARPLSELPPIAKKLSLANLFPEVQWPTLPIKFGKHLRVRDWEMLGNDQVGNCVWAGAAHEHMQFTAIGDVVDAIFTTKNVIADYSAVTGFDPRDPDSDQGTDMEAAAEYRRKTGIIDSKGVRHKIKAHLRLRPGDLDELATAGNIFEITALGVMWPKSAWDQFDDHLPFTVVPGSPIEGGHYMPVIGRNSAGHFILVTYGRLQAATPEWVKQYADEAKVYLTDEFFVEGKSPLGFDLPKLEHYLKALGR